jgi:hexosaminidase
MRKTILALACCSATFVGASGITVVPAVRSTTMDTQTLKQFESLAVKSTTKFSKASDFFVSEARKIVGDKKVSKPFFFGFGANVSFVEKAGLGEEGYEIQIGDSIKISASEYSGAFYGAQTLLQLLRASGDGNLPIGEIKDSPKYKIRVVMLDVGRKFIPFEQLKDWVRMLGYLKMNELTLHLNDNSWGNYPGYRLESKKFPGLSSKDGFYTFKQIRELQDFAKNYGVAIVPEIDSPGHALALTKYRPDFAMQEMNRDGFGLAYLDLANPEVHIFMKELFDEVAPLFDAKDFHIGTDEYRTNLLRDPKKRAKYGELFRQYINEMNEYLSTKHGKTVRIWSGYEHMGGQTEPNKSVVIDMWVTSNAKDKSDAGYSFINSSHFYSYIVPGMPYYGINNKFIYNDWTPQIFNIRDKKSGVLAENAAGLLGAKMHIWNDGGPTGYTWNEIARLSWPSMFAMGEKMWGTKGSKDYTAFEKATKKIRETSGISLLNRAISPGKDNVVWETKDKEQYFIANTTKPLIGKKATTDNLEYPWTAEFTITRLSDTKGNDTLISSDLATFYVDLVHKSFNKKKKQHKTVQGVACVRAKQGPGLSPLTSTKPDVLVFDYQVPFNKKVTLKFVGERRSTSLYVDGKLVGRKRIQMVCPLANLGAKTLPESFQGILHKAKISSVVLSP